MFPSDARTVTADVSGVSTSTVVSGNYPKTILGVSTQQENTASQTDVRCDGKIVSRNYATNLSFAPMNFYCYGPIEIVKTGNDQSHTVVTYVPYDTASSTNSWYNQMNFYESLFIIGVVLFFLSFMTWGRISFTNYHGR